MTTLLATDELLDDLRGVVGDDHVLVGEALSEHDDPYSFLEDDEQPRALAAVQPASVEQVQAVVALAVESGVPLWTVSRGRNLAYGGAAARLPGSIVLDLHRMNSVLEVDEELGYVVVEPGRHAIALALVSFDRDDAAQRAAVRAMFPELLADVAAQGYGPYRSHTAFMDLIAAHYDAGDGALRRVVEKIKDALDPRGVLSPGKQGIWPGRSTA